MPLCQKCRSSRFTWKGRSESGGKRFKCKDCGTWGVVHDTKESYTSYGECSEVTVETPRRVRNERDLIELLEIDTNEWQIERFTVGKSEGYRKDRSVEWLVQNGKVVSGEVHDSGKLLIEPLFSVKVYLRRKTKEIRAKLAVEDLTRDAQRFAPKYPKIHYPKIKEGLLLDLGIFDLHFGRLCWGQESGTDFDVKIAERMLKQTLAELLSYAKGFNIQRILIPLGGDFFNSNSQNNTTVKGTSQQEDTRYAKTFKLGRQLAVSVIDECSALAPVDVLIVKGNHDAERLFYLGDALECWYNRNQNVHIDNSPKSRKYYLYGTTLLGFAHGSEEKLTELPTLMALEAPQQWSQSTYREFHTGDKHHRFLTNENGVVIRIIGSLAPPDQWTHDKGFVGSQQTSESFLFHASRGLVAQFTSASGNCQPQLKG